MFYLNNPEINKYIIKCNQSTEANSDLLLIDKINEMPRKNNCIQIQINWNLKTDNDEEENNFRLYAHRELNAKQVSLNS